LYAIAEICWPLCLSPSPAHGTYKQALDSLGLS